MGRKSVLLLLLLLLLLHVPVAQPTALINAITSLGTLRGRVLSPSGVRVWQGVPYATQRRWEAPVDWTAPYPGGLRPALAPGPHCPQRRDGDDEPSRPTSEDCLFLNIWAPAVLPPPAGPGRNLPVLLYLHGGGFSSGMGDEYTADRLLQRGEGRAAALVVTINYRLGALGFLSLPHGTGSNFGLADQRAALRWVRREIGGFGGDGARITLWGESVGAVSIGAHLASPASAGLFQRAILESADLFANSPELAANMTAAFCRELGCRVPARSEADADVNATDAMACLRAAPLDAVERASDVVAPRFPFAPGYVPWSRTPNWWLAVDPIGDPLGVPAQPLRRLLLLQDNNNSRVGSRDNVVEVLLGTNTNEGSSFVFDYHTSIVGPAAYRAFVAAMLGSFVGASRSAAVQESTDAVVARFPPFLAPKGADNRALASELLGDFAFTCVARALATALASRGVATFVYRFDARAVADTTTPKIQGVVHGADVAFVWDQPGWTRSHASEGFFTPEEQDLVHRIGDAWFAFAAGVLDAAKTWPRWGALPDQDVVAVLRPAAAASNRVPVDVFQTQRGWRRKTCALWGSFY